MYSDRPLALSLAALKILPNKNVEKDSHAGSNAKSPQGPEDILNRQSSEIAVLAHAPHIQAVQPPCSETCASATESETAPADEKQPIRIGQAHKGQSTETKGKQEGKKAEQKPKDPEWYDALDLAKVRRQEI